MTTCRPQRNSITARRTTAV